MIEGTNLEGPSPICVGPLPICVGPGPIMVGPSPMRVGPSPMRVGGSTILVGGSTIGAESSTNCSGGTVRTGDATKLSSLRGDDSIGPGDDLSRGDGLRSGWVTGVADAAAA